MNDLETIDEQPLVVYPKCSDVGCLTFNDGVNDYEINFFKCDGVIWYSCSDICKVLQIANSRDASSRYVEKENTFTTRYKVSSNSTPYILGPNNQKAYPTWIREEGINNLLHHSQSPIATAFRHWLDSDVIPSINHTGQYTIPNNNINILSKFQNFFTPQECQELVQKPEFYYMIGDMLEKIITKYNKVVERNTELEPKAEVYNAVMNGKGGYGLRESAHICGLRQNEFIQYLVEKKLIYDKTKNSKRNNYDAFAEYLNAGYFIDIEVPTKSGYNRTQLKITAKGIEYIMKLLKKDNRIPDSAQPTISLSDNNEESSTIVTIAPIGAMIDNLLQICEGDESE